MLLFLYLNFFISMYFYNKTFKKIPVLVWRMVWRRAYLVQVRGNGAQTRFVAVGWREEG